MGKSVPIEIRKQTFWLAPEKAVFWEDAKTLLIADLHLGKSEHFQRAGIPVSSSVLFSDLARLTRLIDEFQATRLIVLGDLIHTAEGVTRNVSDSFLRWRRSQGDIEVIVALGNHDRKLKAISHEWDLVLVDQFVDGEFIFSHDAVSSDGNFVWGGHLHPMFQMGKRRDTLRLPCFWIQNDVGILPSFSEFTRGKNIEPKDDDAVVLVSESGCVPIRSKKGPTWTVSPF